MLLIAVSIAFIAGILFGRYLPQIGLIFPFLASVSIAWLTFDLFKHRLWWKRFTSVPPALVLAFLALGGLRFTLNRPVIDTTTLAGYNDLGTFTLTGWITEPPDVRESGVYLRVNFLEAAVTLPVEEKPFDRLIDGEALVKLPPASSFGMGDILRFEAAPRTPSSNLDFSYRDYLSHKGIYSVIYFPGSVQRIGSHPVSPIHLWLENLRQCARSRIFQLFPQPESGLLAGILLGLDNDLPEPLAQAYRDTGTAHIIAISGFNMAVIAAIFMALSSRAVNPYLASVFTGVGLILYSIMVGGSPSVVRAAVMAVFAMGGRLIGRPNQGIGALCFSALLMCAFDPQLIWDTSFQLSFAATAGLVMFGTPLQNWAEGWVGRFVPEEHVERFTAPLTDYFLLTLAAQVATLPIIAIQFGRISLSSLFANPLVLPVQPAVLVLGGAAALGGMLFQPLGNALAFFAWPLLAYTNRMVEWISRIAPGAVSIDPRLGLGIGVLCATGFVLFAVRDRLKTIISRISFAYLCIGLLAAILTIWTGVLQRPDGKLHVDLIRAGTAVDLMITSPEGRKVAIDPQGSIDELTYAISRSMSPLDHRLDAILLTEREAAKNVAVFNEQLPVGQVMLAQSVLIPLENTSPVTLDASISQAELQTGDVIMFGGKTALRVLAANPSGAALLLDYQKCRILVPGGIDPAVLRQVDPRFTSGLTAILLTPADLTLVPPAWWNRWQAGLIFWQDNSLPPDLSWTSLPGKTVLSLVSDGQAYKLSSH